MDKNKFEIVYFIGTLITSTISFYTIGLVVNKFLYEADDLEAAKKLDRLILFYKSLLGKFLTRNGFTPLLIDVIFC